jgi:hypothetical protein
LRRATISQVTSGLAAAKHLSDLARLRGVRDRIDREYAQPLDVEALAQVTKPIRNREAPVASRT